MTSWRKSYMSWPLWINRSHPAVTHHLTCSNLTLHSSATKTSFFSRCGYLQAIPTWLPPLRDASLSCPPWGSPAFLSLGDNIYAFWSVADWRPWGLKLYPVKQEEKAIHLPTPKLSWEHSHLIFSDTANSPAKLSHPSPRTETPGHPFVSSCVPATLSLSFIPVPWS